MLDDITQCNHSAEADPGEENRPLAQFGHKIVEHRHLVFLLDEQTGFVGLPLPEHVVADDAETAGHKRVPKGYPKLDVLG